MQRVLQRSETSCSILDRGISSLCAEGADIPAVVVGVGMGMEGGMAGVQLLVPEDCLQAALEVLKEFEDQDRRPE